MMGSIALLDAPHAARAYGGDVRGGQYAREWQRLLAAALDAPAQGDTRFASLGRERLRAR